MTADDEGFISLNAEANCREGCKNVVNFAKAMLRHARTVTMPHNQQPTQVVGAAAAAAPCILLLLPAY